MPSINPRILQWARETAGLSAEEAARALHLDEDTKLGAATIAAYERGDEYPSRPLLLRMAEIYRRSLLVFYLTELPRHAKPSEDFRTLPQDLRIENDSVLNALVRNVHVRQRLVLSTLEEAEEAVVHTFVGSLSAHERVDDVVFSVVRAIGFDKASFRRKQSFEGAFAYLRDLVEASGVFVLLMGNLGSHHSNISPELFRGLAIADRTAPFIVVNDQDAKSAWAFTLLHELIHIWIGRGGLSGGLPEKGIEKFCNDVASRILLEDDEISDMELDLLDIEGMTHAIAAFARENKVSRSLLAYRLFQQGRISEANWRDLSCYFRDAWHRERKAVPKLESSPSYDVVRRHRIGDALLELVKRSLAEGILTPTKAGRVLGVEATNVATLLAGA